MEFPEINDNKKFYGIIGKPLGHSLSPIMHNCGFHTLGLDFEYLPFEITEDELSGLFVKLRTLPKTFRGLNVTMPYKQKVMSYLDELDVSAKEVGAVNTITQENGRLKGYNTDPHGALEAMRASGIDLENITELGQILILGSGGGARAVAFSLAKYNPNIMISNRTYDHTLKLVGDLNKVSVGKVEAIKPERISDVIDNVGLIINCTTVGMHGGPHGLPIQEELLRKDMTIFDIVYNPKETQLIQTAKLVGAKVIYGFEMLVYQGAKAFELWTGRSAPVEQMRKIVMEELDSKQ